MLPYRDSRLTVLGLVIFFAIVIGYGYFEARGILFGPKIDVAGGTGVMHDPYVTIQGHAERIASLSMNGHEIPVTENGDFEEPYLLAPGLNRVLLDATDRYGRTREKVIQIVYIPSATSATPVSATSTVTTSRAVVPAQ